MFEGEIEDDGLPRDVPRPRAVAEDGPGDALDRAPGPPGPVPDRCTADDLGAKLGLERPELAHQGIDRTSGRGGGSLINGHEKKAAIHPLV